MPAWQRTLPLALPPARFMTLYTVKYVRNWCSSGIGHATLDQPLQIQQRSQNVPEALTLNLYIKPTSTWFQDGRKALSVMQNDHDLRIRTVVLFISEISISRLQLWSFESAFVPADSFTVSASACFALIFKIVCTSLFSSPSLCEMWLIRCYDAVIG